MRKWFIVILLLVALLLLPLLLLRSERSLIAIAYWSVETFTDLRLELRQPVLRPFQGLASAEEIHLYPKDPGLPAFLSVLDFSGNIDVWDFYAANLDDTKLRARQVIIYVSDSDSTADPAPMEWLQYLGWLPGELGVDQIHLVTASKNTFIFPLKDLKGERVDGVHYLASAQAQYDGEPLDMDLELSALRPEERFTGVHLNARINAVNSASEVELDGEVQGTLEDFRYNFKLDANYTDVGEFMEGFERYRTLRGKLQLQASMDGDTEGFELRDAHFVLDNMPSYGIEAVGSLKYDLSGSDPIRLVAAGELTSMESILDWIDLDLTPLGKAQGSATIIGTLEHPVIDEFILRSESTSGLTVNISGRVDPQLAEDQANKLIIDIQGPELAVLEHWIGPLPYETGVFRASGSLTGRRGDIALRNLVVELGDPATAELRIEGSAENVSGMGAEGLAAAEGLELRATVSCPDSAALGGILNADIPGGFEVSGMLSFAGNGGELLSTGGSIQISSSDIEAILSPDRVSLRPGKNEPISEMTADISVAISDTSALSQYTTKAIPALGPVRGQARLVRTDKIFALKDIELQVDGEDLQLASHGSINDLFALGGVQLHNRFSGANIRNILFALIEDFNYSRALGTLDGSFLLDNRSKAWNLSKINMKIPEQDGPFSFGASGAIYDLWGLTTADLTAHYRFRDPKLVEAITSLPMNPSEGNLTVSTLPGSVTLDNNIRIGDSLFRVAAKVDHDGEDILSATLAIDSPKLVLEDVGLQARSSAGEEYNPSEKLDGVEAETKLEKLLRRSPRYPTDISIALADISGENTNIESLDIHFTGLDKRYTLRRFTMSYDQSLTEIRGIIDLNASPPYASLAGEAIEMSLNTLTRDLGMDTNVTGTATIRGGLTAQGSSGKQLLQSLDGSLALALEDAVIAGAAYDVLATDLLAWIYSGAALEKSTKIDCTMAKFKLDDGVAKTDSLYIETRKMVATGRAELDMVREKIDIKITPRSKSRSLQVPSSVRVKGSFDNPRTTISPIAAAADAYAEVLTLVPKLAFKLFGIKGGKRGRHQPCEAY